MTLFIEKKVLRLVGIVAIAVALVGIQLAYDPIGHYQAAVAKRGEQIRQMQAKLKAEEAQKGAQSKSDKEAVSEEQSKGKNKSTVASETNPLSMVEEAGEHIMTTAKAIKPGFFTEFRLERDRVRDQQLQLLKDIISNPKTGEKTRHNAQDKMLVITQNLGKELEVENLIKAKNYEDAIVFLQEESAVVVIKAKKLEDSDVGKIADLVRRSTDVKEDNIVIIPKE